MKQPLLGKKIIELRKQKGLENILVNKIDKLNNTFGNVLSQKPFNIIVDNRI